MSGKTIKIRSRERGEFDCYVSTPTNDGKVPAVVLASAVHGVDKDVRELADEFASHDYIAAAPDLFWRSVPARCPTRTAALPSARSRGWRKSGRAKPTWRTRSPMCAVAPNQQPRRGDGLLLRRALRDHRSQAAGL